MAPRHLDSQNQTTDARGFRPGSSLPIATTAGRHASLHLQDNDMYGLNLLVFDVKEGLISGGWRQAKTLPTCTQREHHAAWRSTVQQAA